VTRPGFLQRNGVTFAMLAFLATFYAANALHLHLAHRPGQETPQLSAPRMTSEEIRGREDRFKKSMQTDPTAFGFVTSLALLILFAGLAVDATLVWRRMNGRPALAAEAEHRPVPWGLRQVFDLFLVLLVVEAAFLAAEAFLLPVGPARPDGDVLLMANSLFRDVLVGGFIVWLVSRRYGVPPSEIGLTRADLAKNVRRGFVAYLAIVPPLVVLITAVLAVANMFSYEPPPQPVVEIYLRQNTSVTVFFFTVFVAVVGPFLEEVFFRGFAYKALRTRFGVRAGALLSAAVFAVLHANLVALVPIFALGLFLAYLYERTGSLVPGITAHMTHNLLMVGLTLFFKTHSA